MKKCIFLLLWLAGIPSAYSQFSDKVKDYQKNEGFFTFYYDESQGKIYLEVERLDTEFLYVYSLSSGIGSNDIGLDRGQLGNEQLVYFRKAGNKLLLVQPNLKYRAITENALEKASVEQAFASSVLYGFPIVETLESRYIIDFTPFLMQDMHGVAERLEATKQGTYTLDSASSAVNTRRSKAFPQNTEFDVLLTFSGKPKGDWIRSVTPDARRISVTQHHSFVALPAEGYEPRVFDPRSGSYPFTYYDYASPVEESLAKRFIPRHRLEKIDPSAAVSEAVEPIVYYLDNGTPEPVRSALLEGGRWWNQAFEAIGYRNAFQVRILPEDADPLDVRYNVIQWVHRSTRGWSYGNSVSDPRTGEIIKGHVSLGSLRIRQDFLIAQALTDRPFAESDTNNSAMLELALARIRQLSAHEIGHTLGFAHNFAASTNNRASVMDYPHPKLQVQDGRIDFSQAYDTGIGAWDKVSVAYAYSDFPEGTPEIPALQDILKKAQAEGLRYISDADARPQGGAHAFAHLWDNGLQADEELADILQVRRSAMEQFSPANIRNREPYSQLEDVFVPLYFLHRYQTEAAVKLIGGMEYSYAVRGDGSSPWKTLQKERQEQALEAVLRTLSAEELAIPEALLALFPPRAMGYARSRESFNGRTGVSFDALAAAETAADMTLALLLHPQRSSRLVQQKGLDPKQLGIAETLEALVRATIDSKPKGTYHQSVQQVVNFRMLHHLMQLARSADVHPQVTAAAYATLRELRAQLLREKEAGWAREMDRRIAEFLEHPERLKIPEAPKIPDGSPIGTDCFEPQAKPWR